MNFSVAVSPAPHRGVLPLPISALRSSSPVLRNPRNLGLIATLNGNPLTPSDHGLDSEGLVAMPDGTFWVSDEYGPFVVHFDAKGKELERLSPFNGTLPKELSLRSPNEGMEGLTITPDGAMLVGIVQSALNTPGLVGAPKSVPVYREEIWRAVRDENAAAAKSDAKLPEDLPLKT